MAEAKLAPETIVKEAAEKKYINFIFSQDLDSVNNIAILTDITQEAGSGTLTIDDKTHDSNETAQCTVAGGSSGVLYTLKAVIVDDQSPAQTFVGRGHVNVP
jgi:hypothetical protein